MSGKKHKGPGRDSSSAEAIVVAERHAKWLHMRKKGLTFRAIAAEEGVATNAVFEAVHGALKAIREEPAAELKQLELERLDALLKSVWDDATAELEEKEGDTPEMLEARVASHLDSLEAARKLLADRRKVLGLDAPTKSIDMTPRREETVATVVALLENPTEEFAKMLSDAGWERRAPQRAGARRT
jgi:hypothetical protein